MRTMGGVLTLLAGLWCLADGGCQVVAGSARGSVLGGAVPDTPRQPQAGDDLPPGIGDEMKKIVQETDRLAKDSSAHGKTMVVVGVASGIAGILCLVAGVLFFSNRARALVIVSIALALVVTGSMFLSPLNIMWLTVARLAVLAVAATCAVIPRQPVGA